MAAVADRLASVLGRLDPGQLTTTRHVCLTMVANLLATGRQPRPAGLSLVPDDRGHLYAADLRDLAQGVIGPDLLPGFETGMALVSGVPMVAEAPSSIRSAPVRPLAERYTWLFTGLDPEHLATTRDACGKSSTPDSEDVGRVTRRV